MVCLWAAAFAAPFRYSLRDMFAMYQVSRSRSTEAPMTRPKASEGKRLSAERLARELILVEDMCSRTCAANIRGHIATVEAELAEAQADIWKLQSDGRARLRESLCKIGGMFPRCVEIQAAIVGVGICPNCLCSTELCICKRAALKETT
jgi:hypothetical protein